MLTADQIEEWEEKKGKILVVVETMQYFEIEIDADQDPEAFIDSEECRKECADRILNQTTDLMLERVYQKYNPENLQWEEGEDEDDWKFYDPYMETYEHEDYTW